MNGGIYSDQRCPVCGGIFHDNGKSGLSCQKHPKCMATSFSVRFPPKVHKRFQSYELAQRFLTGLRYEVDSGKFDARDYQKDNPLGFDTLARKYLEFKGPFCGAVTIAYVWSLAGNGKRCINPDCRVIHTSIGLSFDDLQMHNKQEEE